MSDISVDAPAVRENFFKSSTFKTIVLGVSGLLAVLIALKVVAHGNGIAPSLGDHMFRFTAFASLTIWMAFAFGISRRNFATIFVLAFASFCELFILQLRGGALGTLASANLGIVVAYALLEIYASKRREKDANTAA